MKTSFFLIAFIETFLGGCTSSRKVSGNQTDFLQKYLGANYSQYFDSLFKNRDRYGIQIIYTKIDRDKNGDPVFTDNFFNVDPHKYFYPASTVKLPTA